MTILAALLTCWTAQAIAAPSPSQRSRQKPSPAQYAASADQPSFTYLDQKTGKPIWTGQASSSTAGPNPNGSSGSILGELRNVRGTFYQNGAAVDHMTAPMVTAAQASGVTKVTASGGVVVLSIGQPDTSMRCDTAVWSSATNQILGTGHVVLRKRNFSQQGSSILIDAKLRTASMPAPGLTGASSGVHAHFQATHKGSR